MGSLEQDAILRWSAEVVQAVSHPDEASFVTLARIADLLEGTDSAPASSAC